MHVGLVMECDYRIRPMRCPLRGRIGRKGGVI